MSNFFMDDHKTKVVMGNKKKDVDVKTLMAQNEVERKKRLVAKQQLEAATLIQSNLRRVLVQKRVANQILQPKTVEGKGLAQNVAALRKLMLKVPEKAGAIA